MKKISIFAALLFTGSMAFAQNNESTTTQNGNGNGATIDQTGLNNKSTLTQSKNNTFTLDQDGEGNLSNFRQGLYGGNTATVNQLGDFNKLTRAGGALQGTNNTLTLDQTGHYNEAQTYQDFKDNGLDIDQLGDNNYVKTHQDGGVSGSDMVINQVGDNNKSEGVKQANGYNYANTQISGSDNWTKTSQDGGSSAYINVTGQGNGNTGVGAVGTDYLSVTQLGAGNLTELDIVGDYNGVVVDQDGSSTADLEITGSYNTMDIMQTGSGHNSTETIIGSNNSINVTQND